MTDFGGPFDIDPEVLARLGDRPAWTELAADLLGDRDLFAAGTDPYEDVVTDAGCRAMRRASGRVDDARPLVSFLYVLGRDVLPLGTVETLLEQTANQPTQYTNGWLARWAQNVAARLTTEASA